MTDPRDQARDLYRQSHTLPDGATKVALLEEAVQLADSVNDDELGYRLREQLMTAATFSGRPDVMLVNFSWCLAKFDQSPERFDQHGLLWKYKWVIGAAEKFPQISRDRIEQLLADMERRYEEYGATRFSVALERRGLAIHFGDRAGAAAANRELRQSRRDNLSNCTACVASDHCNYFLFLRQWKRSLQAARPVLGGRLSCTEQPHIVLAKVLMPLLRLGQSEEAKARHAEGYRLVSTGRQFVREHAAHLRYLALTGQLTLARKTLERHLPGALEIPMADKRFEFFLAARLFCDRFERLGKRSLKLRLPEQLPQPDADGKSDVTALGEWFTTQARDIAQQYDARNGTSAFQEQIDELPELLNLPIE